MAHVYSVSVIGFNATERIMLGSIFNLSMRRNPSYRQAPSGEHADLLLVDGANPLYVDEAATTVSHDPVAVLLVADGDLDTGWHSLPRPLHWARLFKGMDLALGFLTHGLASRQPGARPAPPRYDLPVELTGFRSAPGAPSAPGGAARVRSVPRSIGTPSVRGQRVLYAGAAARPNDPVATAIASTGAQVEVADRAEQVIKLLEQGRYACLFADIALPGMDGYHLCKIVKGKPATDELPVVLLKANASAFERIRASMAGCDAFLGTPASAEEIAAVTTRLVPQSPRGFPESALHHG